MKKNDETKDSRLFPLTWQTGLTLAGFIIFSLLVGFLGSRFTMTEIPGWYATLAKPSFNPPAAVFAPVWTVLYILIGVSFFLLVKDRARGILRPIALGLFIAQYILNFLWSYLFFGLHNPFLGLVDILLLLYIIMALIVVTWRIYRPISLLLVPYFLWVSFASLLNWGIWKMN
jgi:tryptophan-rich sensory protein